MHCSSKPPSFQTHHAVDAEGHDLADDRQRVARGQQPNSFHANVACDDVWLRQCAKHTDAFLARPIASFAACNIRGDPITFVTTVHEQTSYNALNTHHLGVRPTYKHLTHYTACRGRHGFTPSDWPTPADTCMKIYNTHLSIDVHHRRQPPSDGADTHTTVQLADGKKKSACKL